MLKVWKMSKKILSMEIVKKFKKYKFNYNKYNTNTYL